MLIFILGADDREMSAIEALLRECGLPYLWALAPNRDGKLTRVAPGQVATCAGEVYLTGEIVPRPIEGEAVSVEVAGPWGAARIDHHDPHPLAHAPPSTFLLASSIGQVIALLARNNLLPSSWEQDQESDVVWSGNKGTLLLTDSGKWAVSKGTPYHDNEGSYTVEVAIIPQQLVYEAAADHCPAAAMQGMCPGVNPGEFGPFLAESKRQQYFPWMSPEEFARELEVSRMTLRMASPCPELDTLVPTQVQGPDCEWHDAGMQPAGYMKDLRHLEPGTVPAQGSGECYPTEFLVGIVAAIMEGVGFICRIRRRDGKLAIRSNGHGLLTKAGTKPAEVFLSDPSKFGCGPELPRGIDASYGSPTRGFFGGVLVEQ